MGYLLGRSRILGVFPVNVTETIPNPTGMASQQLTNAEREELADLLADDIWFYQQATAEYERRIDNPHLQAVIAETLPTVRSGLEAMRRVIAVRDPAHPERRAFARNSR